MNARLKTAFRCLLTATCALAAVAALAPALASRKPADLGPGKLLVAANSLEDPNFGRTVVLLVGHGPDGALGLIINRPTPVRLSQAVPDLEGPGAETTLFAGGPVEPASLALLARSKSELDQSQRVFADVYFSRSAVLLMHLATQSSPRFRVYAGYAGWGPGQLEGEVDRGDWHILTADPGWILDADPDSLWPSLIPRDPTRNVRNRKDPAPGRGWSVGQ